MFLDLFALTRTILVVLILLKSSFKFFWKLLLIFPNSIFFTKNINSFAKSDSAITIDQKDRSKIDELSDFENELMFLVKNIEFKNINSSFQKNLNDDIKRINTCKKVLVKADKSRNIYQLDKDGYKKYLRENITRAYKKSTKNRLYAVNKQANKIVEELNIDDRIEKIQESEAYITVQDYKKGFPNNPPFRIINQSKSDIGRISKNILDKIN